jgi:uncharacterized protein (TIGR03067 family)
MPNLLRAFLLTLAVASLAFAPVPFPKSKKKMGPNVLEGSWRRVTYNLGGSPVTLVDPKGPPVHLVVEGKVGTFTQGKTTHGVWDLVLFPDEKPARLEMRWRKNPGNAYRGVYKIEDDTLTIVMSTGKGETGFNPNAPGAYYSVFKRAAKGAR